MKPLIIYVDDEPNNLAVFEASLPDEWEIKTFDNPMKALEAMNTLSPQVIVSDQRMPSVSGVQFLEIARKLRPDAIRIIVTGYSDEDLVVESVRKAQVYDYIRKPWDLDELQASLARAIEHYKINDEARALMKQLAEREAALAKQNEELIKVSETLRDSNTRESKLREELQCWVPPFILWMLKENNVKFPIRKDLVGIAFDIVDSSKIHSINVNGRPLRTLVLQAFTEAVLKNGGWRESHSGDSAYAHFGLSENVLNPNEGALATAREFRTALRNLSSLHNVEVECGVAIHLVKQALVDVHTVELKTNSGLVTQKSFDTTSLDIDVLHRMEKVVHSLPGSNVILSGEFVRSLSHMPPNVVAVGSHHFKGNSIPTELFLMPSDQVSMPQIYALTETLLKEPEQDKEELKAA